MMKFSELHEAVNTAKELPLTESTATPIESITWDNKKEAAKQLKTGKFSFLYGEWKHAARGEYHATAADGTAWKLKFFSTTMYDVKNRLRNGSNTKYQIYAELDGGQGVVAVDIGSAKGEGQESREKIDAAEEKMIKVAHAAFGVSLGKFDFKN